MAQWQGDWGFEDYILQRVEDGVPPCMCSTNSVSYIYKKQLI
jgi:hypothetical protein